MINWGMPGPRDNALAYFQLGNQLGAQARERQDQRETRNALATVLRRPGQTPGLGDAVEEERRAGDDKAITEAWGTLYANDPRLAMQVEQRQAQATAKAQEQKRADLPLLGRLLDQSTDEASYQRSLGIAREYGVDTSGLPPSYDPAWVEQQRATIKLLQDPAKQEALSAAGKIVMDMGFKPGTPEFNQKVLEVWQAGESKPYVVGGETRLYTPRLGGPGQALGGVPPEAVEALRRGEGTPEQFDEMFGAGAAAKFMSQGGQTPPASGNFRGGFRGLSGETVTSTRRSAAHNKRVGGVANSYHLTGQARDSVPPKGMSMADYARRLRDLNPHLEVINEGDHVHMEPRG